MAGVNNSSNTSSSPSSIGCLKESGVEYAGEQQLQQQQQRPEEEGLHQQQVQHEQQGSYQQHQHLLQDQEWQSRQTLHEEQWQQQEKQQQPQQQQQSALYFQEDILQTQCNALQPMIDQKQVQRHLDQLHVQQQPNRQQSISQVHQYQELQPQLQSQQQYQRVYMLSVQSVQQQQSPPPTNHEANTPHVSQELQKVQAPQASQMSPENGSNSSNCMAAINPNPAIHYQGNPNYSYSPYMHPYGWNPAAVAAVQQQQHQQHQQIRELQQQAAGGWHQAGVPLPPYPGYYPPDPRQPTASAPPSNPQIYNWMIKSSRPTRPRNGEDGLAQRSSSTPLTGENPMSPHQLNQSQDEAIRGIIEAKLKVVQLKRARTTFSGEQVAHMEREFKYSAYLNKTRRSQISSILGLTERQVKIWFQNRRMKAKRNNPGLLNNSADSSLHSLSSPPSVASSVSVDLHDEMLPVSPAEQKSCCQSLITPPPPPPPVVEHSGYLPEPNNQVNPLQAMALMSGNMGTNDSPTIKSEILSK